MSAFRNYALFIAAYPREQVIGNAVPVKLAEYVATRLASYIESLEEEGLLLPNGQLFEPEKAYKIAWPKLSATA